MTRSRPAPSSVPSSSPAPTSGRRAVRRPASAPAVAALGTEQDGIRTPTVEDLLAVITELRTLVEAENAALARGLPACAVEAVERKEHLATLFRVFYRHLLRRGAPALSSDQLELLQNAGLTLRAMTAENAERLAAALEASRQRVAVVMDVLRQQVAAEQLTYGPRAGSRTPRGHCVEFHRATEA